MVFWYKDHCSSFVRVASDWWVKQNKKQSDMNVSGAEEKD